MFYQPASGHGLPHDPFKAIVAPRPIGWISTRSKEGAINLAPYSFFNAIGGQPPMVMFSSEGAKDSISFAHETGEFVANLVSADLLDEMNKSSAPLPRGASEFEFSGLVPEASEIVAAPRVKEAVASLECKVTDLLQLRDIEGHHTGAIMIVGQVVGVHIADRALKDGIFDTAGMALCARLGYRDYAKVTETFTLDRP